MWKILISLVLPILMIVFFQNCSGGKGFRSADFLASSSTAAQASDNKMLVKGGDACLLKTDLDSFRSCLAKFAGEMPASDPATSCFAGFRSKNEAALFLSSLSDKENIAAMKFTDGSKCGLAFPEAYFLQTKTEFEAARESRFYLPYSYSDAIKAYKSLLASYANTLHAPVVSTARDIEACPLGTTGEKIADWSLAGNWPYLAYMAEALRAGAILTKGDPWEPILSGEARTAFLTIADFILANANSTHFANVSYNDPYDGGRLKAPIGWNNLSSSWDAWTNGTCSPAEAPNLWASSWALHVLATAYKESGESKYLAAFYRGAIYWHAGISPYQGSSDLAEGRSIFSQYGSYFVAGLYTVGGSRFSKNQTDPTLLPIRYHYYYEDPARFALNDGAIMDLALTVAGQADTKTAFSIANGAGGWVSRSYLNLGLSGIKEVAANIDAGNYGYVALDSAGYVSNQFEGHFDFTAYYVARIGGLVKDSNLQATAKNAILSLLNTPNTLGFYGVCLNRSLDPAILMKCKQIVSTEYANSKDSPLVLFATTALLDQ